MQQVADSVFVETEVRGCNPGFVVTSRGVVLIDTPVDAQDAKAWAAEIAKWGEVRYIINTESHLDHTLSNALFDGEVIAHQATRESMLATDLNEVRERVKHIYTEPLPIPEDCRLKLPTITFSEHMVLHLGGHTFHLMNVPGHTLGQTAVYIPNERVVFTGDDVFSHVQTFLQEALPDRWLEALGVLDGLDVGAIVPGHGKVCDKRYLAEQASVVRGWVEAVRKAKAEGLGVDEALKQSIFKDPYPLDIGLNPAGTDLPRRNMTHLFEVIQG